jgi:hypothetical protein
MYSHLLSVSANCEALRILATHQGTRERHLNKAPLPFWQTPGAVKGFARHAEKRVFQAIIEAI